MIGLVNTHAHLAMNLFRGEADDVSLEEFLQRLLAAELASLDAAAVAVGVEAALAESLRGGVTTALDMYWFPEAASEVAARVGFRLLNGPSFMDVTDPFNWVGVQAVVEEIIDDVVRARDDIVELAVRYDEADDESVTRFRSQERVSFRLRIVAVHDHLED